MDVPLLHLAARSGASLQVRQPISQMLPLQQHLHTVYLQPVLVCSQSALTCSQL